MQLVICHFILLWLAKLSAFPPTHLHYRLFVEEQLGHQYIEKRTIPFEVSYEETGPATPVFFVLSPGVNPLQDVEAVGKKLGFTLNNGNFHNVSLGQVRG